MFSIAEWLDSVKVSAGIASDYRLAQLIGKNDQSLFSNYRAGRSAPDENTITKLCELSKDDPAVIAALVQASRSKSDTARQLWESVAARLRTAASTAILSVWCAVLLAAGFASDAQAAGPAAAVAFTFYTSYQLARSSILMMVHRWCRVCAHFRETMFPVYCHV